MYKSQTHDAILGEVVGLIHADELMGTEELENLPLYAYEFTEIVLKDSGSIELDGA